MVQGDYPGIPFGYQLGTLIPINNLSEITKINEEISKSSEIQMLQNQTLEGKTDIEYDQKNSTEESKINGVSTEVQGKTSNENTNLDKDSKQEEQNGNTNQQDIKLEANEENKNNNSKQEFANQFDEQINSNEKANNAVQNNNNIINNDDDNNSLKLSQANKSKEKLAKNNYKNNKKNLNQTSSTKGNSNCKQQLTSCSQANEIKSDIGKVYSLPASANNIFSNQLYQKQCNKYIFYYLLFIILFCII